MRISIVIPSYNQRQYLGATLDSVFLQQAADVEVIVKDGGSTDGSVQLLNARPEEFSWSSERDYGQTDAINRGIAESTGEILAYLNSDDVYLPGTLACVRDFFSRNKDCEIAYGDAYHLYPNGSIMEPYPTEDWNYSRLQYNCFLCQPAVFWRRSLLDRVGVFDERLSYAMDYEFWLRAGRHVPFFRIGQFLAGSRLHAETKTQSQRIRVHREIVGVVRAYSDNAAPVMHWLKHLASISATEAGFPCSPNAYHHLLHVQQFAAWIFAYAEQMQLALDETILDYVERALDEAGRNVTR